MEPNVPEIDRYVTGLFAPESENGIYGAIVESITRAEMPTMQVSASLGKTLHVLALAVGAKRILEIGTHGGYSGTWLASALPADGKLITLELEPERAEVARANFAKAGLSDKIEIRVGPALQSLERMVADQETGFDITFIDADKGGYVDYLEKALVLTRKGGLILADNTLSHNVLTDPENSPIARFNRALAEKKNLVTTLIPTLREDIDGLTVSVVR